MEIGHWILSPPPCPVMSSAVETSRPRPCSTNRGSSLPRFPRRRNPMAASLSGVGSGWSAAERRLRLRRRRDFPARSRSRLPPRSPRFSVAFRSQPEGWTTYGSRKPTTDGRGFMCPIRKIREIRSFGPVFAVLSRFGAILAIFLDIFGHLLPAEAPSCLRKPPPARPIR